MKSILVVLVLVAVAAAWELCYDSGPGTTHYPHFRFCAVKFDTLVEDSSTVDSVAVWLNILSTSSPDDSTLTVSIYRGETPPDPLADTVHVWQGEGVNYDDPTGIAFDQEVTVGRYFWVILNVGQNYGGGWYSPSMILDSSSPNGHSWVYSEEEGWEGNTGYHNFVLRAYGPGGLSLAPVTWGAIKAQF